jgi:hypothetical protein
MTLHSFLTSIPDVIWSGVIASVLTLGGVWMANRSNTTRLRIQLSHESVEKSKQRRADLRKEVYLVAAEESVKANAFLASLPSADFSGLNAVAPLQGFFAAAAKLQMVADTNTALITSRLVGAYGQHLLEFMDLIRPIQRERFAAQLAKQYFDQTQIEIKRILAAMTALNESGKSEPDVFGALGRSLESQREMSTKFAAEQQAHLEQANAFHLGFVRHFLPAMKEIGTKTMTLMIEIRREFDIESDGQAMVMEMQAQWAVMEASADSMLRSLTKS